MKKANNFVIFWPDNNEICSIVRFEQYVGPHKFGDQIWPSAITIALVRPKNKPGRIWTRHGRYYRYRLDIVRLAGLSLSIDIDFSHP